MPSSGKLVLGMIGGAVQTFCGSVYTLNYQLAGWFCLDIFISLDSNDVMSPVSGVAFLFA